ncbi:ATP-binding protein [Paenibacillus sp. TAF58]
MSNSTNERKTLLQYWTTRYVIVLAVGLLAIAAGSFYFMEFKKSEQHMEVGRKLVKAVSSAIQVKDGRFDLGDGSFIDDIIFRNTSKYRMSPAVFMVYLVDTKGFPLFARPGNYPPEMKKIIMNQENVQSNDEPLPISMKGTKTSYFMNRFQWQGKTIGYLYLLLVPNDTFELPDYKKVVYLMFAVAFVLGWGILYLLTRRLIKPLQEVAAGAKQIMSGSYSVEISSSIREKELFEVQESFGEMAKRLGQLEYLRTKLLAGVTHELRTPVTSISGLVQAVRDEVVTGEDAKQFLNLCHKETQHLQRMVEDLLEFNSFAVGAIKVLKEQTNLNEWLRETVQQWSLTEKGYGLQVELRVPSQPMIVMTDGVRLKQVLINLLNNAKAATPDKGRIMVVLSEEEDKAIIEVHDTGTGITEQEQSYIFENFFRGENKKNKVRGMGLGLPLCTLIMKELDGDIKLRSSSSSGTIFSVSMKKSL